MYYQKHLRVPVRSNQIQHAPANPVRRNNFSSEISSKIAVCKNVSSLDEAREGTYIEAPITTSSQRRPHSTPNHLVRICKIANPARRSALLQHTIESETTSTAQQANKPTTTVVNSHKPKRRKTLFKTLSFATGAVDFGSVRRVYTSHPDHGQRLHGRAGGKRAKC